MSMICVVKTFGCNAKNKRKTIYFCVPSFNFLSVTHSDELPQPVFYDLPSDDVLVESFHSLLPVHYERPGR